MALKTYIKLTGVMIFDCFSQRGSKGVQRGFKGGSKGVQS